MTEAPGPAADPERASRPARERPEAGEASKRPHAAPLDRPRGEGQRRTTGPSTSDHGIAAPRGRGVPGARGGPSGDLDREQDDALPEDRRESATRG